MYTGHNVRPAYCLRYAWTGWPSAGSAFPESVTSLMREVASGWEADGLRLLEARCDGEKIQALFSATPHISPVSLASRVKGRLDHALRRAGPSVGFSRKLAVRTVGNNRTSQVEAYIRRQVSKWNLQIRHSFIGF